MKKGKSWLDTLAIAFGVFVAILTGCGGGGGGSDSTEVERRWRPDVSLPDTSIATQKALTPDNSKQALILALNSISFIEDSDIPALPVVDFYANSFSFSNDLQALSRVTQNVQPEVRSGQVKTQTVDVSHEVCYTGSLVLEGGESIIGREVQHYRDCDLGGIVLDGDIVLDIRGVTDSGIFTDATFLYQGLRITDDESDTVFDGSIVMTTDFPGAGFIEADLDIRDLIERSGMRVVDYRADFEISNFKYLVRQLSGRIYDDRGEYFDLGLSSGNAPWPMLIGKNSSLSLSPSGLASPYQVKIALDTNNDNATDYWLFAALDALDVSNTNNNNAPEFHSATSTIRLDKDKTHEVRFGPVTDADQQFVSIKWSVVEKPYASDPIVDSFTDGFVFSSNVAGDYRLQATATDGEHLTTQDVYLRVMYDMPEISFSIPSTIGAGATVNFLVDVLNPEEGNIHIVPLALPGLTYDQASRTATYTALLPEFGVDQQINVGFVIYNEDRQQTVTSPLAVHASPEGSAPVMIAAQDTSTRYQTYPPNILGQFTPSASKDLIYVRSDGLVDVFELDGVSKRYRESFELRYIDNYSTHLTVLSIHDLNKDGYDEIIYNIRHGDWYYHLAIYDPKRHRVVASIALDDVGLSDMVPKTIVVADLEADGADEIIFSTGTKLYVFDDLLQLQWQSSKGLNSGKLMVTNIDDDASLEIVTSGGYIFDGATLTLQTKHDISANGTRFFAADMDGDGISEAYQARDTMLNQMTVSNYSDHTLAYGVYSNVVVANIDDDAADEVLFLTIKGFEPSQSISLCKMHGIGGIESLAYMDLDDDTFTVHIIKEFEQGCSHTNKSLVYKEIEGEPGFEYLISLSPSTSSFIYRQDTDTIQLPVFIGPKLTGNFSGGAPISTDGRSLTFCGSRTTFYDDSLGWYDIFSIDTTDGFINADKLWISADDNLNVDARFQYCLPIKPDKSDRYDILSLGSFWNTATGEKTSLIDLINADEDESNRVRIVQDADPRRLEIADIDGNDSREVVLAGNGFGGSGVISTFDLMSGEAVLKDIPVDGAQISNLAAGDLIAGNGRDEIFVTLDYFLQQGCMLQILAYDGVANLQTLRQKLLDDNCSETKTMMADIEGDGKNEILISQVDDKSEPITYSIKVLDTDLQVIARWSMPGYINSVSVFQPVDGAALLSMLEINDGKSRIVWRDSLSGRLIYQSPEIDDIGDTLNMFVDYSASKLHAVVTNYSHIYLTQ